MTKNIINNSTKSWCKMDISILDDGDKDDDDDNDVYFV